MPAIDYQGVRDQLESILKADSRTSGARIFVEEEPQFGLSDAQKAIAVFMDRRSEQASDQMASAGKRTRYTLSISLWTVYFDMSTYRAACDGRDALMGQLELVLMDNRTIGGKVTASWREGGEMFAARDANSQTFVAAAETVLVAEVSAISP